MPGATPPTPTSSCRKPSQGSPQKSTELSCAPVPPGALQSAGHVVAIGSAQTPPNPQAYHCTDVVEGAPGGTVVVLAVAVPGRGCRSWHDAGARRDRGQAEGRAT
ncbi:hypothetical protein GCM10027568_22650 [Humibacter soli]